MYNYQKKDFLPAGISRTLDNAMRGSCNNKCNFCKPEFKNFLIKKEEVHINHRNELPKHVLIDPTLKCNLSCKHCIVKQDLYTSELSTENLKKILLNLKQWLNKFDLDIGGGEPFLRKDIIELLKYCKKLSITPDITTNGTLINKELARQLVRNLEQISISLDGLKKTHDSLRGIGNFNKTLQGIRNLQHADKNFCIVISTVIWKNNINELISMVKWAKKK